MLANNDPALTYLRIVQAHAPKAIIAGGYLRDRTFGRSVKDIDIFVPYAPAYAELLDEQEKIDVSHYAGLSEVYGVWTVRSYPTETPVQIIMLREGLDPVERARHHDFDFCQLWHDGWREHATEAFYARNAYEVTLVHCESEKEFKRSMRRWNRLQAKYPDMTLVIPARFAAFQGPDSGSIA